MQHRNGSSEAKRKLNFRISQLNRMHPFRNPLKVLSFFIFSCDYHQADKNGDETHNNLVEYWPYNGGNDYDIYHVVT